MRGSTQQSTSRSSASGTTDSCVPHVPDCCRCTLSISNTPREEATAAGRTWTVTGLVKILTRRGAGGVAYNQGTHRRKKNAKVAIAISVDHIATARVCSLRFLGIFDGANLHAPTHAIRHTASKHGMVGEPTKSVNRAADPRARRQR